jgi:hypothetical protein
MVMPRSLPGEKADQRGKALGPGIVCLRLIAIAFRVRLALHASIMARRTEAALGNPE